MKPAPILLGLLLAAGGALRAAPPVADPPGALIALVAGTPARIEPDAATGGWRATLPDGAAWRIAPDPATRGWRFTGPGGRVVTAAADPRGWRLADTAGAGGRLDRTARGLQGHWQGADVTVAPDPARGWRVHHSNASSSTSSHFER